MKKRISVLLLTLCLVGVLLPLTVQASSARLGYVTDSAHLLTQGQAERLETMAQRLSEEYQFGIYIVTVEDYRAGGEEDLFQFAIDWYDGYHLGYGSDSRGTMLLLSMADRDYHLHFNSEEADRVMTEYARDIMEEEIVPFLRDNDYYEAFRRYLELCSYDLEQAAAGTPVDREKTGIGAFALIPGVVAAGIAAAALCAPMHTAKKAGSANEYLVDGSLHLTQSSDTFLHRTVTRQHREPPESHSSGGGGVSMSSGSHSGRSGKF